MLQVSQQEVMKTHYPYKEPRIDQRMYQADIPALRGGDSNRAVTRGSSSPRAGVCVCVCVKMAAADVNCSRVCASASWLWCCVHNKRGARRS